MKSLQDEDFAALGQLVSQLAITRTLFSSPFVLTTFSPFLYSSYQKLSSYLRQPVLDRDSFFVRTTLDIGLEQRSALTTSSPFSQARFSSTYLPSFLRLINSLAPVSSIPILQSPERRWWMALLPFLRNPERSANLARLVRLDPELARQLFATTARAIGGITVEEYEVNIYKTPPRFRRVLKLTNVLAPPERQIRSRPHHPHPAPALHRPPADHLRGTPHKPTSFSTRPKIALNRRFLSFTSSKRERRRDSSRTSTMISPSCG